MSKILKGMQKLRLEQGFEVPAQPSIIDKVEKEAARTEMVKSIAVKFNAVAISLVIGIVVYHLGSLLSGQNVTTHMLKEQRGEIVALTQQIKQAQDRFAAQEGKINDLLSANKALRKEVKAQILTQTGGLDTQLKKVSVQSARTETGLLELKQGYAGVKEELRQLNKKIETLQPPAVVQQ